MLQLSKRASRRIGACYIYPSCLSGTRGPFAAGPRLGALVAQHGRQARTLSSTAARATTSTEPPDSTKLDVAEFVLPLSEVPPSKMASRKKKKHKAKADEKNVPGQTASKTASKTTSKTTSRTNSKTASQTAPTDASKQTTPKSGSEDATQQTSLTPSKATAKSAKVEKRSKAAAKALNKKQATSVPPKSDLQRQLEVLQGALAALRNVLATQNINVDTVDDKLKVEAARPPQVKPAINIKLPVKRRSRPARQETVADLSAKLQKESLIASRTGLTPEKLVPFKGLPLSVEESLSDAAKEESFQKVPPGVKSWGEPLKEPLSEAEEIHPISVDTVSEFPSRSREPRTRSQLKPKAGSKSKSAAKSKPIAKRELQIQKLRDESLSLVPIDKPQPPVPSVSYGLERVLFNPGVYQLQDPRSRVFNFDPYLSKIMPVQEFDFNALKQYVTSSKDETLISIAREQKKKYTGSTSSMTSVLAHFHFLLSAWRPINSSMMSQGFEVTSSNFTKIMKAPAATFLHWRDGVYAIDADKEFDSANILMMLGKSMEKLLTLSKEDYERYRRVNSDQISEEERNAAEAFHYTGLGDFMMRSQLDAHDPRIPGTGMFDLKTRAVISIRMDARGYEKGVGYELRERFGSWESYEREYHDMIRAAFLKYSLQVRMGRMDGIFVAFHNVERIFGFQYISLGEMDHGLHGTTDTALGDKEFKLSLGLLNELLDRATRKFPEQSLRLHFETRPSDKAPFMYVFAKPVTPGEVEAVQNASKASVADFERQITEFGTYTPENQVETAEDSYDDPSEYSTAATESTQDNDDVLDETPATQKELDAATWEEVQLMVDEAMEDDEVGIGAVRAAIEDALEESGLLEAKSVEHARGYVEVLLSALTGDQVPSAPDNLDESTLSITSDVEQDGDMDNSKPSASEYAEQAMDTTQLGEDSPGVTAIGNGTVEVEHESYESSETESLQEPEAGLVPASETELVQESESQLVRDSNDESLQKLDEVDSSPELSIQPPATMDSELLDTVGAELSAPTNEIESSSSTEVLDEEAESEQDDEVDTEIEEQSIEADAPSTSSMLTLRYLIKHMAQKVDQRRLSEAEQDADDASKLKDFERILGDMIAQSTTDASSNAAGDPSGKTSKGPPDQDANPLSSKEANAAPEPEDSPLLGMVLTIRNRINEQYVTRPDRLCEKDSWEVEYNIEEMKDDTARRLYQMCQARRWQTFAEGQDNRAEHWNKMFGGALKKLVNEGRTFRKRMNEGDRQQPVYTVGEEGFKTFEEVFGVEEKESSAQEQQEESTPEEQQQQQQESAAQEQQEDTAVREQQIESDKDDRKGHS